MSTPWRPLEDGEVCIAHLSDLHFGSRNDQAPWTLVMQCLRTKVKPALLLVTGDLVDTPDPSLYNDAKKSLDSLNIPYFVCCGNHDKYRKGNQVDFRKMLGQMWFRGTMTLVLALASWMVLLHNVSWWWTFLSLIPAAWVLPWLFDRLWGTTDASAHFHRVFEGKLVSHARAEKLIVGQEPSVWTIGLFGVDSSHDADVSARGYVPEELFQPIADRTENQDWDLCIFLVHHHLLSIRNLEARRRGSRRDLFNLTCLVNSGSLLETLAAARVDLVLHGHEHAHNWAGYRSFNSGSVQLGIIGAGSATGNDSLQGCDINRATFNVIILAPNRSASLRRLAYQANEWVVDDELRVLDSSDVRRSRIQRAMVPRREIESEILKHVEFTRARDIWVNLVLTNWDLEGKNTFTWEVFNSTGVPSVVRVRLFGPRGYPIHEIADARLVEGGGDHKWNITFNVPESHRERPLTIEICYRWLGGAALTESELQRIKQSKAAGYFRTDALEFATIWTPVPVASAEMFLLIPSEYAPEQISLRVTENQVDRPHEAAELTHRLRPLAVGSYTFRIPFPHILRDYALVWKPIAAEGNASGGLGEYEAFCGAARKRGNELLGAFCAAMGGVSFASSMNASLYLKSANPFMAERVGFVHFGSGPEVLPPAEIPLISHRPALTTAWWGEPVMILKRQDLRVDEVEFVDGEQAVICVPVRFGFGWINPPPWGVVRLGILENRKDLSLENTGELWTFLSVATMKMLTEALSPPGT